MPPEDYVFGRPYAERTDRYGNPMDWTSYDQVPWYYMNPQTTSMARDVIDLIIASNRGEQRTARPTPGAGHRTSTYGQSNEATMGLNPGAVGSIPGLSWRDNQLHALSRAKNDAIAENFGGYNEWAAAGSPQNIFSHLPTKEALQARDPGPIQGPWTGKPLFSDLSDTGPETGSWFTQREKYRNPLGTSGALPPLPGQQPGSGGLSWKNRGVTPRTGIRGADENPMFGGTPGSRQNAPNQALTQALMRNWGR